MKQDIIQAPIIPISKIDPTGQDRYVRDASSRFQSAIRDIRVKFEEKLKGIKRYSISANNLIVNRQYLFEINEHQMRMMFDELSEYIDQQLNVQDENNWFYRDYVEKAYSRGTAMEYSNLLHQSPIFAQQSLGYRRSTEQYRRRISLVRYRVFEEMQNLTAKVKSDMTRVLSDGIAQGMGIGKISDQLKKMEGINQNRANTIARTEITTAYRRARTEEHEQAKLDYGLQTKLLHISALTATSRISHVERHGKTYTKAENDDFYSRDGNAINCLCVQISVLVDSDGNVINDILMKRIFKMREASNEYTAQLSNAR